jgi:trehalose-6-phosphate synthase
MSTWSSSTPTAMWLEFQHSRDPDLKVMIDIFRVRTIIQLEHGTRITLDNADAYDVHEDYAKVNRVFTDAISKVYQ